MAAAKSATATDQIHLQKLLTEHVFRFLASLLDVGFGLVGPAFVGHALIEHADLCGIKPEDVERLKTAEDAYQQEKEEG